MLVNVPARSKLVEVLVWIEVHLGGRHSSFPLRREVPVALKGERDE
mgnify:CR=1 FL=1